MSKRASIILISLLISAATFAASGLFSFADNSVLASGKWVKIKLVNSGVYKLTYSDITTMGFSDPSKVRVYGFGGAMLPEAFKYPKKDTKTGGDIPEVPVYKGSNYILFWAQGVVSWKNSGSYFNQTTNTYSSYAYYFLTDSKGAPSDMTSVASITDPDISLTTYDDYDVYEKDLVNVGATGREFYGEDFSLTNTRVFTFNIPGVNTNKPLHVTTDFISKSSGGTTYKVSVNNQLIINSNMPAASADHYENAKALNTSGDFTNTSSADKFDIKIEYGKTNDLNCRLNYIRLNMERDLKLYNSFTAFRSLNSKGVKTQYTIQNTNPNVKVWDITNGNCIQIEPTTSGAQLQFAIASPVDTARQFVAVDVNGSFPKPEFVGVVENQNLHALQQTDMVILCPPDLLSSAEKLATLHRDPLKDNLRVTIVQPEQVYNEFSSGTPDGTAYRWFMKMFYDRAQSASDKPKYLLLFGDGTFDNRLLSSEWKNSEHADKILTYESVSSLVETSAYVCDDYFGFLDDNEGENIVADGLDLGIGRFPVRNIYEADAVVNKVIGYAKNTQQGTWKNNLCFVADDGDDNGHMRQSDQLTQYLETNYKQFAINKIFLDSYKKSITSTGGTYPSAKKKLFDLLNSGVMAVNYTGHGSVNSWAVEQIMTTADIKSLYLNRLPLWVTATCDFSRFDDFNTTAGEEVLLNPKGGGIGLITTTRVVYSAQNFRLNSALNELLLKKNPDGTRLRLGDIIRQTKIALGTSDQNKLNFTLLGDPALKLAYAEYKMEITAINGQPIDQNTPTLPALSEVTLAGRVLTPDGVFDPTFVGIVKPTVYDSEEDVTTLDNDKTGSPFTYKDRNKILFTGKDSIRNGEFTFKFTIPKDMSYSFKSGRVNLYGSDNRGNEAQGYYENFLLGGTNPNATADSQGPTIKKIFLNSESFISGDVVNETPLLVVDLEDQNGLNVSGTGIGHDLLLVIDNSPSKTYVLNNSYEANSGSATAGKVSYVIPELTEGNHTLYFRAWDIQNNSSSQTINCTVKKGHAPRIFDLYTKNIVKLSSPEVVFSLRHDRPNTNINVKVSVYNLSGIEVWSHSEAGLSDMFQAFPVRWDLKGTNGLTVTPGVYLYKATIYTDKTQETTLTKKMIIIN
ncbi:MAG: type IX secretion system sortase PorU [Bacteroidales bacterium]|nr:type IX secretion system sortase PorU [Bacteroidales bacterium]